MPLYPKSYLIYILFSNNFGSYQFGYQMVSVAAQAGPEKLTTTVTVPAGFDNGYLYIYVANESNVASASSVYFDDLYIKHIKAALALQVTQVTDYYPFGLAINPLGYQKNISFANKYKFQGQEHIDDLGLNWDSFKWRNHQPDIGRFFNIDPLASKYVYNSPYAFSENRVINGRELEGLEWVRSTGQQIYDPKSNGGKGGYTEHATNNDKRLGNSLQGTAKGQEQFGKLVNSNHPITTEVNMSDKPVINPKTGGITTADTKNTRDSYKDLATGKVDGVEVQKSEIVINVASMEQLMEKGGTFSGESLEGLTFDQFLGAVLGHEIEHTTDANNLVDANKQDAEKPAHEVSKEIIKETKANKDEKKKE